uniref:Uncharacterized protein n=1 Tax=Nymphaea colorata TaxID=210225 RepID=A0A5K1E6T3_9MAGN
MVEHPRTLRDRSTVRQNIVFCCIFAVSWHWRVESHGLADGCMQVNHLFYLVEADCFLSQVRCLLQDLLFHSSVLGEQPEEPCQCCRSCVHACKYEADDYVFEKVLTNIIGAHKS